MTPIRSMTGSGTFAVETAMGRIEAEARSVNNRFLKSTVRSHGPLRNVTAVVEKALRKSLQRGHVTVHLRFQPATRRDVDSSIDPEAFASAAERLTRLAKELDLAAVTTSDVLAVPGVLSEERAALDDDVMAAAVLEAVDGVVASLLAAREREGALMAAEVESLLASIAASTAGVSEHASEVPAAYRARLQKRMEELLRGTGVEPDPQQLARECAVLAEKSDVREEIARLDAHVEHARGLLAEGGAVGRRLDFLAQELHREANTTASKTNDLELSRTVLDLKSDVERLREQVQNLE